MALLFKLFLYNILLYKLNELLFKLVMFKLNNQVIYKVNCVIKLLIRIILIYIIRYFRQPYLERVF